MVLLREFIFAYFDSPFSYHTEAVILLRYLLGMSWKIRITKNVEKYKHPFLFKGN